MKNVSLQKPFKIISQLFKLTKGSQADNKIGRWFVP